MALYNLRSADGDWRITKFDGDLNVESSYLVSTDACECPAGHRPSCRHRQMLPRMLAAQAEDSPMFYDFDRDTWLAPEQTFDESETITDITASEIDKRMDNPTVPIPGDSIVHEALDNIYNAAVNAGLVSEALTEGASTPAESRTHPQGSIRRRL